MFPRRTATALAAATVLCATAAPAALATGTDADAKKPKPPAALYGKGDPTYDGVWRQSMTLLAQDAAGATPAAKAVDWLAGQQCADGSFTAYRAEPGDACDAKKTPADTNATAIAVQALSATGGRGAAVDKALDWLRTVQNKDGGWGYNPGGPTDANSVSVVIGAFAAAGERPEKIRKGDSSPYDALAALQLGCDAKAAERGAFAYQPGKDGKLVPNDDATAAAALAGLGSGLSVKATGNGGKDGKHRPVEPLDCGKDGAGAKQPLNRGKSADAGAAHLVSVLNKHEGHLKAVTPGAKGTPDYANTADAVIALGAGGHHAEAKKSLDWLGGHFDSWDKAKNDPAAISGVMLAVHATGGDPATLKGAKLLDRLNATGPKPARMPDKATGASGGDSGDGDDGNTVLTWSLVGAGLASGAGLGILLSSRRKRRAL